MAQTGYTPILVYASGTASNVPLAANLTSSASGAELALNYADGKLYFKNSSGVVTLLASSATVAPVTTFSAGTTGFTPSTATSGAVTLAGTLATTNGGTGLTSFTANGVVYASSTSALATGSALTFNGTDFATTGKVASGTTGAAGRFDLARASDGAIACALGLSGNDFSANNGAGGGYIFNISSSEQMRLTSTGLGIGTSSPAYKLDVAATKAVTRTTSTTGTNGAFSIWANTGGSFYYGLDNSAGTEFSAAYAGAIWHTGAYPLVFATSNTERMRLDSSGNLGLGVTPSAWNSAYKALQILGGAALFTGNTFHTRLGNNTFVDSGGFKYLNTGPATYYSQNDNAGSHAWFTAASGTAGNAISFTQAMTLDSSGNLGIGTSSPSSAYSGAARVAMVATTGTNTASLRVSSANASAELYSAGSITEWGLYSTSNSPFVLTTNSNKTLTLDSSGNLGLGVTPSAWATVVPAFQIGSAGGYIAAQGSAEVLRVGSNNYYNAGWKYVIAGYASRYDQSSGTHAWYTAASGNAGNAITFTQAMTLDASGNLLVGVTSATAAERLNVTGAQSSLPIARINNTNNTAYSTSSYTALSLLYLNNPSTTAGTASGIAFGTLGSGSGSVASIGAVATNNSGYGSALVFQTRDTGGNDAERARIDSSGNLLVGTTTQLQTADSRLNVAGDFYNANGVSLKTTNGGASAQFIGFLNESGTLIGSIQRNSTTNAVLYNTTSDQRLKSNVEDAAPVLDKLMQVQVRQYDWTEGNVHQDCGFIAQEIEPILSGLVTKGKSENDLWQLDYSKLTPYLVKALQELKAEVDSLKAQLKGA